MDNATGVRLSLMRDRLERLRRNSECRPDEPAFRIPDQVTEELEPREGYGRSRRIESTPEGNLIRGSGLSLDTLQYLQGLGGQIGARASTQSLPHSGADESVENVVCVANYVGSVPKE
jgi:hypothetical protein